MKVRIGLLLTLWSMATLAQDFPPPAAPVVREIEVRFVGPETVNRAVVQANIQTAVGKPRSAELIEQDVRNLINTGFFADVRVLEEAVKDGVKVIYQVQGKATIKDIVFQGGKRYKEERLRREISLKPGDILSEQKLHADARKIVEMYQKNGFADAKVTPEVNVDRDTGKAVVRIKVEEGNRVFLKQVSFTGLKAFSAGKLKKLMKTRHYWWASWLTGTGVVKDGQLQEDLEKIRELYRENGYMDVEIPEPQLDRLDKKWVKLQITVKEGQQYRVGKITIEGNKLFAVAPLEKTLKLTEGKVFASEALRKDTQALEDYYGARGYLDTAVRAVRTPNVATGRLDLQYVIREGELSYVERIDIRGNTRTKDKVLRRELAVAPGDIYDTVRVDRSVERLKNLGYFSKVESRPEPTTVPNRKNLVLSVEEQRTGNVTFGAGFSTIDSLMGFVEITQGNFDLFNWPSFTGGGQKMRLRAQFGLLRQDYTLSFTEPWFLDRQLSFGFDLFHRYSSYQGGDYEERRTGGDIRIGKPLNQFTRVELQYAIQQIEQSITSSDVSREIRAESGTMLRSSLTASLAYDTRDSVFLSRRGQRSELTAEVAGGPLGGDVSLYKLSAHSSWYFSLFNDHILQLVAAGGVVDVFGDSVGRGPTVQEISGTTTNSVTVNDVPMSDRYFLGGANTLRGFDYRKVGPKDINGEPVGGNTFVQGTAEYTIPIVERIRFALFFDIGEVQRDSYKFDTGDLKADIGAGIRLNLPVGPLRFDYGWPIISDRESGRTGRIQFSVGYQF